jgi:anti-sigma-K factor RskA
MNISDEVLMAYADGELDMKTRREVEDAIAADPRIARRVADHRALRDSLRSTYDKVLEEPVPERLLAAARQRAASQSGVVVPLRPLRRARTPSVPYWGAIAASFVVGALVWHFGAEFYSPPPVTARNGQLVASGVLDRALSTQLVQEQSAQSAVQIGVSFRAKGGTYCRTFQLRDAHNLAGLACREQNNWKLQVLAQGEAAPPGQPEFRPAGSSMPAAIAQAVDQSIEGEPLDAQAEAHARTNQWRFR